MNGMPALGSDWINQRELSEMLGISQQTACTWAKDGRLRLYEHGARNAGRRKYSRTLITRELEASWEKAVQQHEKLRV